MSANLISIIIPAKNCQKTLEKCLNSIFNLEYKNYEVIIVDDASNDQTCEIIGKFSPKIKIITNKIGIGPSNSRNIAANVAKGEYLAFTDSDCIVDNDWLNQLMKGFNSFSNVAGCGGAQLLPLDATDFEKKAFLLMQKAGFISDYVRSVKSSDIIEVKHNASCCVMYRKDVFLINKGFLEGLWPGEDVELDYRLLKAGLRLTFNPGAVVYHYRPKTFSAFMRMMKRYGVAQGCLLRKYGFFRKVHFVPFVTTGAVIVFSYLLLAHKGFFVTAILCLVCILFLYLRNIFVVWLGVCSFVSWHAGFLEGFIKKET